jgi:hypothetical protein
LTNAVKYALHQNRLQHGWFANPDVHASAGQRLGLRQQFIAAGAVTLF